MFGLRTIVVALLVFLMETDPSSSLHAPSFSLNHAKSYLGSSKRWARTTVSWATGEAKPILGPWPAAYPAKDYCSKCGLCDTSFVANVTTSCAFIGDGMARAVQFEEAVHGRSRLLRSAFDDDGPTNPKCSDTTLGPGRGSATVDGPLDEARFGVLEEILYARAKPSVVGSQWSGVVTTICQSLMETGAVDAVALVAADPKDALEPLPILARTPSDLLRGRGVKPSLAPSLALLNEVKADPSIKRLLFCGVGCSVQALRAVQADLGLDELYVLGTHCVDNSPSVNATKTFLNAAGIDTQAVEAAGDGLAYEFMADFKVHVKRSSPSFSSSSSPSSPSFFSSEMQDSGVEQNDSYEKIPYFCLPGTVAEVAIAPSCLTCFDYTNGLADLVVGYMGAPLEGGSEMTSQWQQVTVRNPKGRAMLSAAQERLETIQPSAYWKEKDSLASLPWPLNVFSSAATNARSKEVKSLQQLVATTTEADAVVMRLRGQEVPAKGLPRWVGDLAARVLGATAPKGLDFARYSIDYHYLRNYLYAKAAWGPERAARQTPKFVKELVESYNERGWVTKLEAEVEAKVEKAAARKRKL